MGKFIRAILATIVSVFAIAAWTIIGLFYWIPMLARSSAWFSVALMVAAVNNKAATSAARALDHAASFYVRGYQSIVRTLFALFAAEDGPADEVKVGREWADSLQVFLTETAFAAISWLLAFAFFYYWFGSLDFLHRWYQKL
jgi:hypothetical protein